MWVPANSADWLEAFLAVFGYGILFNRTIRQNRNNRPVVLGVWTVVMFGGFLALATLRGHPLLRSVVTIATILLGIMVLFFVGRDVVRWRRGKSDLKQMSELRSSSRVQF